MTTPWRLRLYVAGSSADEEAVAERVRTLCGDRLASPWDLEVVDLAADPARAVQDGVLACPTLVRLQPGPEWRLIGDLGNCEALARALGLPDARAALRETRR